MSADIATVDAKQDRLVEAMTKNNDLLSDIASGIRVLVDRGQRL